MSAVSTIVPFTFADLTTVLADNLSSVLYPAESMIFQEGERASCAYLIERGRVQIVTGSGDERRVVAVLESGALLGEMAPIDEEVRSASAVALEETEVIPIGKDDLRDAINAASPLVQLLVKELLNRLRSSTASSNRFTTAASKVSLGSENDHQVRGRAVEYLKLKKELRDALRRREFELHFQPIVRLNNYSIAGFEALIRWRSPVLGFVNPGDFIPAAEDSGLIVPIGLWVLEHSCHMLQRFQARFERCFPDLPPLFMSANVSARQLREMKDVENISSLIKDTAPKPEHLKLEITEGILVEDPEVASAGLEKLKQIGVSFAIDDFGTGYSSLSYLNRYPLDTLKIDRSFVSSMLSSTSSLKIVQAITTLARELEMDIVAEGVEEPAEVEKLTKLGCQYAQGYLYSKPKSIDRVMEMLDDSAAWDTHVASLGLE